FFSPEAEMALMGQDDGFGHLFPSSTCQSSPSIMYSPLLQQMSHRPPTSLPGTGQIYPQPHDYRAVVNSPYPPQFWPSQTLNTSQSLQPDASLLPQSTRPSGSDSASSTGGLGILSNVPVDRSPPPISRSLSLSSPDLQAYGYPNKNGGDLRKHHKRHIKPLFCRHEGCPQSTGGGFSSKKELARHEAGHNHSVRCDWEGCNRVFSRVDNMRDHVKRMHLKTSHSGS
ncbi:hypothetical protein K469DRAFT_510002, partial [Zopfia rhizophila CBS 207.26]